MNTEQISASHLTPAAKPRESDKASASRAGRLLTGVSFATLFIAQAASAQALTFQGTIQFSESPSVMQPRGMSFADAELWVCGTWVGAACSWSRLTGGRTDATGNYSWTVAGPRDQRDQYQVRIYARNSAAIVWQQDTGSVFWSDVLPNAVTASRTNPVQTLSRTFGITGNELFVSRHLNAAQKLLPARDFALKYRDPTETDTLGRVIVGPSIATGTAFTNSGVIRVNPNDLFDEHTLVHEYGHFVQESIGAYYLWPSWHDGCFIGSASAPANTPEFAWFEGFPEFFSMAVRMVAADSYADPVAPRTLTLPSPYAPAACGAIGMPSPGGAPIVAEAVENRVRDFLFLLLGDSGPAPVKCPGPVGTQAYRDCAMPVWSANAALVMSIFDKELDFSQPKPVDVDTFYAAWLNRGADRSKVDAALHAVGMATLPPPPPPPSRHDRCIAACNKELATCMADARTGAERGACVATGRTCKAACPN